MCKYVYQQSGYHSTGSAYFGIRQLCVTSVQDIIIIIVVIVNPEIKKLSKRQKINKSIRRCLIIDYCVIMVIIYFTIIFILFQFFDISLNFICYLRTKYPSVQQNHNLWFDITLEAQSFQL